MPCLFKPGRAGPVRALRGVPSPLRLLHLDRARRRHRHEADRRPQRPRAAGGAPGLLHHTVIINFILLGYSRGVLSDRNSLQEVFLGSIHGCLFRGRQKKLSLESTKHEAQNLRPQVAATWGYLTMWHIQPCHYFWTDGPTCVIS